MTAREEHHPHLRREALTMALYVAVTLVGARPLAPERGRRRLDLLRTVGATTKRSAAAQWLAAVALAFAVAARTHVPG